MIKRIAREDAEIVPLPGRDWHSYFGPADGVSSLCPWACRCSPRLQARGACPPRRGGDDLLRRGPRPDRHPGRLAEVWPGVVVHVPPGTFHATESDRPGAARAAVHLHAAGRPGLVREEGRAMSVTTIGDAVDDIELDAPAGGRAADPRRGRPDRLPRPRRSPRRPTVGGRHPGGALLPRSCVSVPTSPTGRIATGSSCRKGHSSIGLYATIALRGYFPVEELPDVRRRRLAAPGPSGHDPAAGPRHVHGFARHGHLGGRRDGARRPPHGPRRPDLRDARRRRVPGGRGLGGGLRGGPLRPRQPRRDRRPQQAPAVRLAGRRARRPPAAAGPGRARRQVDGLRLARPRGRRPRHGRHRWTPSREASRGRRPSGRDHRQHRQGPRRLVHGGPLLLAHPGDQRPRSSRIAMAELGEPLSRRQGAAR